MTYQALEMEVVRWGEARGIVQNSNPMAQSIKMLEEVTEVIEAVHKKDKEEIQLELGDVMVTAIIIAATLDVSLVECLQKAYKKIKHRKGYLTAEGVFVKETK